MHESRRRLHLAHANGPPGLVQLLLSQGTMNVVSNGSGNPRLDEFKVEDNKRTRGQRNREKRAVEYTLYNKELRRVREGLDKVKHARKEEAIRLSSLHEEVCEVQERILSMQAEEKAKGNALKRNAMYVRGLKNNKELRRVHEGLDEVMHARNEEQ
jgi:hypothetical protein